MLSNAEMIQIADSRQPKYRAQVKCIDGSWSFVGSTYKNPLDAKHFAQAKSWPGSGCRVIDTTNGAILNL